jgi:hypothetical protein
VNLTIAEVERRLLPAREFAVPGWLHATGRVLLQLFFVYLLLLAIHAYLGWWSPEFLKGRSMWHFWFARMVIPMIMFGVFAAFARPVPAGLMLGAGFLFVGTLSAIKRSQTGEPFQFSDLFLAGQSVHLLHYVHWYHWMLAASVIPAGIYFLWNLRLRWWSLPLAALCVGLLSTYRIEAVAKFIHDNSYRLGIENLTFSQAESERMNGLGRISHISRWRACASKTYTADEVRKALDALSAPQPQIPAAAAEPVPMSTSSSAKPGGGTRTTRPLRSTSCMPQASPSRAPSRRSMAAPRPIPSSRC